MLGEEQDSNLHTDMERILEMIVQAKLLSAITPIVPEYRKVRQVIRPRGTLRGYALLVKEAYEAYRKNRFWASRKG
ncbi:MAG: hypothetical protein ACUVQY_03910 [Thermoproteota archaeon]